MARTLGDGRVLAQVLARHGLVHATAAHTLDRLAMIPELIALGEEHDSPDIAILGHGQHFDVLMELGEIERADQAFQRAQEIAATLHQPYYLANLAICRAGRVLFGGDLDATERWIAEDDTAAEAGIDSDPSYLGIIGGLGVFALATDDVAGTTSPPPAVVVTEPPEPRCDLRAGVTHC